MKTFAHHVNLNERGSYYADVRNPAGQTVFTIKDGNALQPEESSVFDDGFMRNAADMYGLKSHLVWIGIMRESDDLVNEF